MSRKPYFRTTTPRNLISNTTDQSLESTNQQTLEDSIVTRTETSELADLASALQKVQQAPIPQAKPSRKRPQILPLTAQYTTSTSTRKPTEITTTTTEIPFARTRIQPQKYNNKKTVAISLPFLRGTYIKPHAEVYDSTPQSLTSERFVSNYVHSDTLVGELRPINAQEYVSKYTASIPTSTRSRSRFSITETPLLTITPGQTTAPRRRKPTQPFQKVLVRAEAQNVYKPLVADYDYYDNIEASILGKIPEHSKVLLHGNGIIECLDQGNFPHPVSCKKFIYCAKMDNDKIVGWEYTCPKNLSFDPIGGICNWSAGLGCNDT